MAFADGDAYGRFMGRFSVPLAPVFLDFAELPTGARRVLDVGCGPGVLTEELVRRLGPSHVAAVDPSAGFVEAARQRLPGVDVRLGGAEALDFEDHRFDAVLAQLVVHFMDDPRLGVAEMLRVTRPGGRLGACVWDHVDGRGPLTPYWSAARELDLDEGPGEPRTGSTAGDLTDLLTSAGATQVEEDAVSVTVAFATFEDWWTPFTLGVGPPGDHYLRLDGRDRGRMADACRELLPPAPFELTVFAWAARGLAPGTTDVS